ncbi:MAG TPA: polysaccharide biosynthesis/export family protein [Candidatus Polarisedimenticolaceae bacterium]|nr:polysaccharide biosynthesis/export family protein [Candidatus Polarisedimenticolaceae bacterium]
MRHGLGPRALAILAIAALLPGARAAEEEPLRRQVTAEIRISFPAGSTGPASLAPGDSRLVVIVPHGSTFPLDFAASSAGLLRGGAMRTLEGGRVQLDLELVQGVLDEVVYQPDGLLLRLKSRYGGRERSTDPESYRVGPKDKLTVTIHNHTDLAAHPVVSTEGSITLALIGDVQAAGLTTTELADRIAERYGRDILVDPEVDVAVEEYESQWVMVAGEVHTPGRIKLKGGATLKEVLAEAGSFTLDSGEEITISRKDASGEDQVIRVERGGFESGEDNPRVRHGDIIDVTRAQFCYVKGEVRSPGRVKIERGTTLLRALTQVSGLTEWAQEKAVRVLDTNGSVQVYNLKQIERGKAPDPLLRGGEMIVVDRRFF